MKTQYRLFLILAIFGLSLQLRATTYFVSTGGSDLNDGSFVTPWASIREGIQHLQPGDTLMVRGGEYIEAIGGSWPVEIQKGTPLARITVQAFAGERVVLKGIFWLDNPSYWTIDGINVAWLDGMPDRWHMIRMKNGVGWTFRNAEVSGARSYAAFLVVGTRSYQPANWRIEYCVIHHTHRTHRPGQDHLIYVNTGLSAGLGIIQRNILYYAPYGSGVKLGGPFIEDGTQNVTIRYNTIYSTMQSILIAGNSRNNRMFRNMFEKVADTFGFIRGYQLVGENNVAYDNVGCGPVTTFILNDPGYLGVQDGGGNIYPIPRQFQNMMDPTLPFTKWVQTYGRYAGETRDTANP